ncbi:type-2 ice-structuring protein-like isoform X2 [Esox lucius]|uniref:type-2 ice-structuring protein-like isoform X2 n=1 Tax=Esox lucius TaxID=8010 RepID=UPI0014774EB5|nr:type-2 ice-structuring protein-like isoform X2 [Esox lucius]
MTDNHIYGNYNFELSTRKSGNRRNSKIADPGSFLYPRETTSPSRRIQVLLVVLSLSLLCSLCALGVVTYLLCGSLYVSENNQIDSLLETKDGHLGATASAKMTDIPLPTRSAAKSTKLIVNWTHSRDHCVSMGGHLVIINSQQEQTFLRSMNVNSWIGLNDFETEGWWLWVDNKPLSQTGVNFWIKWGGGVSEPNNSKKDDPSGENCARLSNPEGYSGWVDAPCGELHAFVCEGLSVN